LLMAGSCHELTHQSILDVWLAEHPASDFVHHRLVARTETNHLVPGFGEQDIAPGVFFVVLHEVIKLDDGHHLQGAVAHHVIDDLVGVGAADALELGPVAHRGIGVEHHRAQQGPQRNLRHDVAFGQRPTQAVVKLGLVGAQEDGRLNFPHCCSDRAFFEPMQNAQGQRDPDGCDDGGVLEHPRILGSVAQQQHL